MLVICEVVKDIIYLVSLISLMEI